MPVPPTVRVALAAKGPLVMAVLTSAAIITIIIAIMSAVFIAKLAVRTINEGLAIVAAPFKAPVITGVVTVPKFMPF